jgi:hypothetical protein
MKIKVELWPENSWFPGKRVNRLAGRQPRTAFIIEAEPADMELLIAEYSRTPARFEQEAARSMYAAMREFEAAHIAADEAAFDALLDLPAPEFSERKSEEVPPYGQI